MSAVETAQSWVPSGVFERMVALRRELHRHPELSWKEHQTADRVMAQIEDLGLKAHRVAQTGLVVDIGTELPGPVVAIRADLDALPIQEETGLEFASVVPGVMHACGHDGHSSMLVGALELLLKDPPPTPVRLLWQPAEERGSGALAMIEEGVLDDVAIIFGGHVDRSYPHGTLVVTEGPVNASTDLFTVNFHGQSGHGARPHEALDAVVVGSLFVNAIQTIVSREVNPAHPSVVSIGSFQAGSAPNVIAGSARLEGTIRAQEEDVRAHLCESIRRVAQAVAQLHGANLDVEIHSGTPPLINEPGPTDLARSAAIQVVGSSRIRPLRTANMGGEDFAWFLKKVPGCYVRFGAQVPGRESFPAHSSRFDFDERALGTGAAWFAEVARIAGQGLAAAARSTA